MHFVNKRGTQVYDQAGCQYGKSSSGLFIFTDKMCLACQKVTPQLCSRIGQVNLGAKTDIIFFFLTPRVRNSVKQCDIFGFYRLIAERYREERYLDYTYSEKRYLFSKKKKKDILLILEGNKKGQGGNYTHKFERF